MRKKGFTLAEVLITLSIIGVVAALTIPAVTKSFEKSENIARYKETYSMLSQATQLIMADNGGTMEYSFPGDHNDFASLYATKIKISKRCNYGNSSCSHPAGTWSFLDQAGNPDAVYQGVGFITNKGILMSFFFVDTACNRAPDNCGFISFDTNGFKAPNKIGKDIHMVMVHKTGIRPFGATNATFMTGAASQTCKKGNSGFGCGLDILKGNYDPDRTSY